MQGHLLKEIRETDSGLEGVTIEGTAVKLKILPRVDVMTFQEDAFAYSEGRCMEERKKSEVVNRAFECIVVAGKENEFFKLGKPFSHSYVYGSTYLIYFKDNS